MRCERYWREGVLLVERGRPDPHRETCLDCRREHEARNELVRSFALVGAHGGDPRWQARVWKRIDGAAGRRSWLQPWVGWSGGFAAAACALLAFVWFHGHGEEPLRNDPPRFEIVPSEIAKRTTSAGVGDRVRIWVRANQEARIYRAEKLLLRCTATGPATPGCSRGDGGVTAEHTLTLTGDYQLVIVPAGIADPVGVKTFTEPGPTLDRDLAAITAGGGTYQLRELAVH